MSPRQQDEFETILHEDRARAATSHNDYALNNIDAALERIHMYPETYGLCVRCGEEIDADRLHIVPATRYCEDHAEMRPLVCMGVSSSW